VANIFIHAYNIEAIQEAQLLQRDRAANYVSECVPCLTRHGS